MHTLYVRLNTCEQTMGNTGSAIGKIEGKEEVVLVGTEQSIVAIDRGEKGGMLRGGIVRGEKRGEEEQEKIVTEQVHSGRGCIRGRCYRLTRRRLEHGERNLFFERTTSASPRCHGHLFSAAASCFFYKEI